MGRHIKYTKENAIEVLCFSHLFCYRDGSKHLSKKRAGGFSFKTGRRGVAGLLEGRAEGGEHPE